MLKYIGLPSYQEDLTKSYMESIRFTSGIVIWQLQRIPAAWTLPIVVSYLSLQASIWPNFTKNCYSMPKIAIQSKFLIIFSFGPLFRRQNCCNSTKEWRRNRGIRVQSHIPNFSESPFPTRVNVDTGFLRPSSASAPPQNSARWAVVARVLPPTMDPPYQLGNRHLIYNKINTFIFKPSKTTLT